MLGSGSTFIIYMILARHLGVEQFGLFSSAFANIAILSLFAGFGVSQSWLKHFGTEGWNAIRWLPSSFKLVIISIAIVLLMLFLWAFFGPHDSSTQQILLIMSFFVIGQIVIELVSVKLQLEEKYSKLALWQLLPNLLRLIFIATFIFAFSNSLDVIEVAYIYALVAILFIFIGLYQLKQMKTNLDLKGHGEKIINYLDAPKIKEVLSHSWAFGIASVFAFIYLQSDIIMVKYISGDEQAGLYNIGFVIMTAILILPTVFYQKFLMPKVHRWANSDKRKFYENYKRGNIAMLLSGLLVLLLIYFLSSFFIPWLFGGEYIDSIELVKILSFSLPFYFIAYNVGITLVANEHMKQKVKLMGVVALLNIILNLLLIPTYQAVGAATATVLSNVILLILYYTYAEKKVFKYQKGKRNVEIN
ncbi:membrane protein involved in the export of O-antigen and teichoic acid [Thiovulum sp. ES]|nr:membrane protein involved in the export of O-antigen and teichoic acid [Thiovulum sp. ES]